MKSEKPLTTYKFGVNLWWSLFFVLVTIPTIYFVYIDPIILDKHVYIEGVLEINFSPFWAKVNHVIFQLYMFFMLFCIYFYMYHSHIKKKYIRLYEDKIVFPQITKVFRYSDGDVFYDDITGLRWSFRRYTGTNYKIISKDKTIKLSNMDTSTKKMKKIDKFIRERAKNLED